MQQDAHEELHERIARALVACDPHVVGPRTEAAAQVAPRALGNVPRRGAQAVDEAVAHLVRVRGRGRVRGKGRVRGRVSVLSPRVRGRAKR